MALHGVGRILTQGLGDLSRFLPTYGYTSVKWDTAKLINTEGRASVRFLDSKGRAEGDFFETEGRADTDIKDSEGN